MKKEDSNDSKETLENNRVFLSFLGIFFTSLSLLIAWGKWSEIEQCRNLLENGVEEVATVTDQAQTISLINNPHHGSRPQKFTWVKFGLYRGSTRFAVQGPTVDIIHEPISEDANPRKGYNLLVGRKSDGLFSVFSENYGWTAVVSWSVLSVLCALVGLGVIIRAFFPNDKQKAQQS